MGIAKDEKGNPEIEIGHALYKSREQYIDYLKKKLEEEGYVVTKKED